VGDGAVTLERRGAVAVLTLDRPAKRNAITNAMAAQLATHAGAINADDAIRAVLLRGAGAGAGQPSRPKPRGAPGASAEAVRINPRAAVASAGV